MKYILLLALFVTSKLWCPAASVQEQESCEVHFITGATLGGIGGSVVGLVLCGVQEARPSDMLKSVVGVQSAVIGVGVGGLCGIVTYLSKYPKK
jgi:hypothetical protein